MSSTFKGTFSSDDRIILDKDFNIISCETDENTGEETLDFIMRSLRLGDRRLFCRFCEADDVPYPFEIFRLLRFGAKAFVFVEKSYISEKPYTTCILGESISNFIPFMSPDNELYMTMTGRMIYEIMLALEHSNFPENSTLVTPETLTCYAKAPKLFDELLSPTHNAKECDIHEFIGIIINSIMDTLMFCGVKISIDETSSYDTTTYYPINPVSLVHVVTAGVHILSYLSTDRKISLNLDYHRDGVILGMTCNSTNKFISDCGSFLDIAEKYSELRFSAAAMSNITTALGYEPSIRFADGTLKISIRATRSVNEDVQFKYDDPYGIVPEVFDEAMTIYGIA